MINGVVTGSDWITGIVTLGALFLIHYSLTGQVSHSVGVTSNVYTPADITVNAGDTVIWVNTQGNHNVNGTTASFPDNPESFGNDVGAGWTFTHIFTVPGDYGYQCDPHAGLGMIGKITVTEVVSTGTDWNDQRFGLTLYPVPATDILTVDLEGIVESISIYTVDGSLVLDKEVHTETGFQLSLEGINPGIYIIKVKSEDNIIHSGRFLKH